MGRMWMAAMHLAACVLISLACTLMTLACGRVDYDSLAGAGDGGPTQDAAPPAQPRPGIYRSVGVRSTPLVSTAVVGIDLQIADGTATFSSGLPDNVGVGDALEYDTDGDGSVDALAFISGRGSSTSYTIAAEDGTVPPPTSAATQGWELHRAYLSLADAAIGDGNPAITLPFDNWAGDNDTRTHGLPWHLACYDDGVDIATARFEWTTTATLYLRIYTPYLPSEVGVSQRHRGRYGAGYRLETPGAGSIDRAIVFSGMDGEIDGLQIHVRSDNDSADLPYNISITDAVSNRVARISNNILRGSDVDQTSLSRGVQLDSDGGQLVAYIWNNIIYDIGGPRVARGIEISTGDPATAFIFNNTFVRVYPAIFGNNAEDQFIVRNTVTLACGGNCLGGFGQFQGSNNVGNRMDDESIGVEAPTDVVTDYFVADDDFHLDPDAPQVGALRSAGADLSADSSLPVTVDIDGEPRSIPFDIGADQLP